MNIPVPEFNEELLVEYLTDHVVYRPKVKCTHIKWDKGDDWILPRGIRARNEAGFNSTVICLDCLLEWAISEDLARGIET